MQWLLSKVNNHYNQLMWYKLPPYSDELGQAMGLWKPHSATQHTDIPTIVGSQQCSDAHKCLLPCPSHQAI